MKKKIIAISVAALMVASMALVVEAHPGRTDGSGGHTNHSTGEYHYHHGYSAHDHYDMDGDGDIDCPYNFKDRTDSKVTYTNSDIEPKEKSKVSLQDGMDFCVQFFGSIAIAFFLGGQITAIFSKNLAERFFSIAFGITALLIPILFVYLIASGISNFFD